MRAFLLRTAVFGIFLAFFALSVLAQEKTQAKTQTHLIPPAPAPEAEAQTEIRPVGLFGLFDHHSDCGCGRIRHHCGCGVVRRSHCYRPHCASTCGAYGWRAYRHSGRFGRPYFSGGYLSSRRGYWQPGGYAGRIGSPYYYRGNGYRPRSRGYETGYARRRGGYGERDAYARHFGPGFYRRYEYGHYRFPYYSYRRPWYFPGPPSYNRDTNFAW